MRCRLYFAVVLALISFNSFGMQKILDAYLRNDRDFRIRCEFEDRTGFIRSIKPASRPSFSPRRMLHQNFEIQTRTHTSPFDIKVFEENGTAKFELNIQGQRQVGRVEEGNNRYLKKQMRFTGPVMSKVICYVEFATENLWPIHDGKYHINVHPHQNFDVAGRSIPAINEFYRDPSFKHLLLLEDNNYKESNVNLINFLRTGQLNIPATNPSPIMVAFPINTDIRVSPAGVNRYEMKAQDSLTIYYTGGNHNYCMFNNVTQVLDSLMRSENGPVLNIVFKQSAIVAQRSGVIDGLSFGRFSRIRRNNLFSYLMDDQSLQRSYHENYFGHFANNYFSNFAYRFKQVVFNYQAPHYQNRKIIRGSSDNRILQVNIRYE